MTKHSPNKRRVAAKRPSKRASSKRASITVLPPDVLTSILCRLSFVDSIRSSAVCSSWSSLVSPQNSPPKLPWLMLPRTKADQINSVCKFYSLSHRQEFPINLPSRWSRCVSSCDGWLMVADHLCNLHMLNPLTGVRIPLPPSTTFPDVMPLAKPGRYLLRSHHTQPLGMVFSTRGLINSLFRKALVVWSSDSTYTVAVLHGLNGDCLSFARQGDAAWTTVALLCLTPSHDLIYYKGKYCVLKSYGAVDAYDLDNTFQAVAPARNIADMYLIWEKNREYHDKYLVEYPGGELLLVRRCVIRAGKTLKTVGFQVRKLAQDREWIEMKSLGEYALFVGANNSVLLPTRDCSSLRGNCIYFTDDINKVVTDDKQGTRDLGVFDLQSQTIGSFSPHEFRSTLPLPMWFTPNLSKQGVGL